VNVKINTRYPSIDDLRTKAQKKIPKFAFEYLGGGCNEDINLHNDTSELREVKLKPNYLRKHPGYSLKTALFGVEYDAPFGIAPVRLQGLKWPKSPKILVKVAFKHNIPFVLSTFTTSGIDRSFMYGVSALKKKGGNHTISLLKTELQQVLEQLCCEKTTDFPNHLI
jgi:L-lactate dehydrogenase (cytochrome)